MSAITYLILGGGVLTIGDIVFKFYTKQPRVILYLVGLLIYLVGEMFLIQSFKTENIAVASTIFVVINVVSLSLVSWFYFNEKLSAEQVLGVLLAMVAIALLEFGK